MCSYYDMEKVEDFRIIYNHFWKDFRITILKIAPLLGVDPATASKRINQALDGEYVIVPQIRKRSFKNFTEYVYIIRCKNPLRLFKELKEDETIIYHAVLSGFCNMWIISKKKLTIDADILVEGVRSDYHIAHAPFYSFDAAQSKIQAMVSKFNVKEYRPKGIIQTHWDEEIEWWDPEFDLLYKCLKFNARTPYTPIMKEYKIPSRKISYFFRLINETCTVFTQFFPKGMAAYDPYLFMIETDYEDFIIELFSALPTSPFFFKAENKLFVIVQLEKTSIRESGIKIYDVSQIWIPCLFEKLQGSGIIRNEQHASFEYHCSKNL